VTRQHMPLSLAETQHLNRLADLLYPMIPGKPHPYADPRISFQGVAQELRLAHLWAGGSKLPAITELVTGAYSSGTSQFATLILEVVRRGLSYRESKQPVTREEIDAINEVLLKLKLRIRDLHDLSFLETLPTARRRGPTRPAPSASVPSETVGGLSDLARQLDELSALDATRRGFAFEGLLSRVFAAFDLAPKGSFRLTGEQIDGSFHFAAQTYLLEAKWQGGKIGQADLLVFAGKVSGEAMWTRGLFVSLSGYSDDGLEAFARGKQTNLICFDGLDLHAVLAGKISLPELLTRKTRAAAESNRAFISVRELVPSIL
jgi:hypothetical protein